MGARPVVLVCALALAAAPLACTSEAPPGATAGSESEATTNASETSDATSSGEDTDTGDTGTDTGGEEPLETFALNHGFGVYELAPFEEVQPCAQWTLDNDDPIYVQAVTLSNHGYFHHSNWFVVPEDAFEGPDGYFDCDARGFSELLAAALGTVLTAQSTQSFTETQRTQDGAVIKIPSRHKVIAATHMLNFGPATISTELFTSLELIHPKHVEAVLAPLRLNYGDLTIPPMAQSRFTGVCDAFGAAYADGTGQPLDMKLHYVLPHFHYLGNSFALSFEGGEFDGQPIYELDGFNGEGNGRVFDPPLDLSGVTGLNFSCGYDNWRDVEVGFGIGDQEMCVMLGLVESAGLTDISVNSGTLAVGEQDGVLLYEAPCEYLVVTKNPAQGMPTQAERDGPFNLPPSGDDELPPVPVCVDHDPAVAPNVAPTLTNVASVIFSQSCSFNACHGATGQAAGLNLSAPDLLTELLNHEVLGDPGASLVEPGDPDNSWLYQLLSRCAPENGMGTAVAHMPLNAPILLSDPSVALVREWIAAGAPND